MDKKQQDIVIRIGLVLKNAETVIPIRRMERKNMKRATINMDIIRNFIVLKNGK